MILNQNCHPRDDRLMTSNAPRWYCERDFQVDVRQCIKARLLHAENTSFQDLKVFDHRFLGRVLVLDDIIQTTTKDEFVYHEMMTHVPLTAHGPTPDAAVLIIGGGDGGILREVLRHEWVSRVVMVEIDEAVIRTTRELLGFNGDYDDPRVELLIEDGSTFVASETARSSPFDLIVVDAPDPVGPAKLLYRDEFTSGVKSCLKQHGAMVRHIGLPFPMLDMFRDCQRQLRQHFATVEIYMADIPSYIGGNIAFAVTSMDGCSARAPNFEITGRYYNSEIHRAAFALPSWWREALDED